MLKRPSAQTLNPLALNKESLFFIIASGLIKLGLITYGLIVICVIISNLSLFSPNWPFSLIASFSETLVLAIPAIFLCSLWLWRRAILPIAALCAFAFYPVVAFDKFIQPSEQTCVSAECVTIVAANLRHHPEALTRLAETHATTADIIALVEVPHAATSEDLLSLFPMGGEAQVAFLTDPNLQLGSRLAVISRRTVNDMTLELVTFPESQLRPRGILRFNYPTVSGDSQSFNVVHSPPPKGIAETESRDAYLQSASEPLYETSNFVLIGDFNMTPWESGFHEMPGKRAGDPRWSRTWNARKFWQRITIDHALIGEDLQVQEFEVGPDIGSDHFPIRVVVHYRKP